MNSVESAAAAKKPPTEKQLKMKANRATALRNLTARLGKPARAANAARLVTLKRNKPDEVNSFINSLVARNGKPVTKKNTNNKPKNVKAMNAKPKNVKTVKNTKPKNVTYHKFKYNSVEREGKALVKKLEEVELALEPLGYTVKGVCKMWNSLKKD